MEETPTWQESFHVSIDSLKPIKRFDDFKSVDWIHETLKENSDFYHSTIIKRASHNDEQDIESNQINNFLAKTAAINPIISRLITISKTWVALSLIGIMVGLIAGLMDIIVSFLSGIKLGRCTNNFYLNKTFCCWGEEETCSSWQPWTHFTLIQYIVFILLSCLFGYIAAVLCRTFAPTATGSGISEVKCIASGFKLEGFLGWWTLFIKSIALPLTIASGLSVGKEGPSVHYAACAGNLIPRMFKRFRNSFINQGQFLTAASAAGVAVAFGSPIGGVLFSIEEISNNFRLSTLWKSYFCALIATGTLSAVNPFRTGQIVMFEVKYDTDWKLAEIPFFIILGIFGGLYGILVAKFNIRAVAFRQRHLSNFAIREVVILCLISSMIGYFNQFLRLDMTETMGLLFRECGSTTDEFGLCKSDSSSFLIFTSLILATLLRMIFVIISYGCKIPCGIFVPSMAAGATFGRAVGIIAQSMLGGGKGTGIIIPGTYAFLGAAAALSGITHLTVAVVVIMFELTGAIKYVIPTMIVVAVTKSINDKWGNGGGIADQMIKVNGMPFIDPKEDHDFHSATVKDVMSDEIVAISETGLTYDDLETLLAETQFRSFPVVKSAEDPTMLGYLNREDLIYITQMLKSQGKTADYEVDFSKEREEDEEDSLHLNKFIRHEYLKYAPSSILEPVFDMFLKLGPRFIIVEQQGKLIGLVTRKDIIKYEIYLHHQHHGDVNASNGILEQKIWAGIVLIGRKLKIIKNMIVKKMGLQRYVSLTIDDETEDFEI